MYLNKQSARKFQNCFGVASRLLCQGKIKGRVLTEVHPRAA